MTNIFKKCNILFFFSALHGGGAQRVFTILLNHLDRRLFNITLVLLLKEGDYLDDIPKDIDLIVCNKKYGIFAFCDLIRIIRGKKIDVVFSSNSNLINVIGLLLLLKPIFVKETRFVTRQPNPPTIHINSKEPLLKKKLFKFLYPLFDRIICISQQMKSDFIDNFFIPENKLVLILNPIDIKKIESKTIKSFQKNNSQCTVNLLAAGRLSYQKGFDILIKTMALLEDKFRLTIIGKGEDESKLIKLRDKLALQNRVIFAGFQDNPYQYMKASDIFVLPSRFEGCPNVVLEALACGVPVVATNSPGEHTNIIKNGKNGYLSATENHVDLAQKIRKCAATDFLNDQFSDEIIKQFSISAIIKQYEKAFLDGDKKIWGKE